MPNYLVVDNPSNGEQTGNSSLLSWPTHIQTTTDGSPMRWPTLRENGIAADPNVVKHWRQIIGVFLAEHVLAIKGASK